MATGKPIGSFYVQLGLNTKEFQKNLKQSERDLKNTFGSAAIRTSQMLAAAMTGLAVATAAVGAAAVKMAADLERQQVAFTRLLGSAEEASKKLQSLQAFAAVTPYTFTELVEYEKRLLALGFAASDTRKILTTIGDAASGLGLAADGVGRIIKAFGDIKTKGAVATQELNQLGEAGINARQILADGLGKSVLEIMGMVENRAISAETAITALTIGINKQFGGMMQLQSQTMLGLWSTVQDETENILRAIGTEIERSGDLKGLVNSLKDSLTSLRVEIYQKGVLSAFTDLFGPKTKVAIVGIAGAITGALIPALKALTIQVWASSSALIKLAGFYGFVAAGTYALIQKIDKVIAVKDPLEGKTAQELSEMAEEQRNRYMKAASDLDRLKDPSNSFRRAADSTITNQIMVAEALAQGELAELKKIETALSRVTNQYKKNFDALKSMFKKENFEDIASPFTSFYKNVSGKGEMAGLSRLAESDPLNPKGGGKDGKSAKEQEKYDSEGLLRQYTATALGKKAALELEYKEEKAKLDKSKALNTNYRRDVLLLDEIYYQKRIELARETADEEARKNAEVAQSRIDYDKRQAEELEAEKQALFERIKAVQEGSALEAQLNEDRQAADFEMFVQHLNDKTAAERAYLEGRRELIDTYDALQADANRSNMSYIAEGYRTVYSGLTDALTGIITGAKNAGQAFKELGMQIIQMVVKWQTQKRLAAVMSKSLEASQMAASVSMAAATAAAWAPAAAMVAAATFGASTAAGAAGLTTLSAMSKALTIPGLANGGVVSQPTLAMIGEGKESEAVLPLSKLDSMLSNGGGGVILNVYNQSGVPVNARSSQRMDGRKTVIDLFLSGYGDNVSGIQDVIGRR